RADFALTISGDSMEPIYHNGDIVLVKQTEAVSVGEVGIFVVDGDGYIKKFGGDRLISLNQAYADIMLNHDSYVRCCGKVIGRV
ncbi:MAG: helix-turn-helix transcriptional regulator, partial [Ruminococcus sp.]|nr:helix-turn-helix transcriptional regulator [Ruminococcus sp.]